MWLQEGKNEASIIYAILPLTSPKWVFISENNSLLSSLVNIKYRLSLLKFKVFKTSEFCYKYFNHSQQLHKQNKNLGRFISFTLIDGI